jgi:SNF2 family DNA or RNA helicase
MEGDKFTILQDGEKLCKELDRPVSFVNGIGRQLIEYERSENSVTLIQYQSGASGLNLQKANKIIYYSPTHSAELYMQSKKRTHRHGQDRDCFYYYLITEDSIEEKIYKSLEKGEDYTNKLFERGI